MPIGSCSLLRNLKAAQHGLITVQHALRALNTAAAISQVAVRSAHEASSTPFEQAPPSGSNNGPCTQSGLASSSRLLPHASPIAERPSRKGKERAVEADFRQAGVGKERRMRVCAARKVSDDQHVAVSGHALRSDSLEASPSEVEYRRRPQPQQVTSKYVASGATSGARLLGKHPAQRRQRRRPPIWPPTRLSRFNPALSEAELAMIVYLGTFKASPTLSGHELAGIYAQACDQGFVELEWQASDGLHERATLAARPSVESWARLLKLLLAKGDHRTLQRESRRAIRWEQQQQASEAGPSKQSSWLAILSQQLLLSMAANSSKWGDLVPLHTQQIQQVRSTAASVAQGSGQDRARLAQTEAHAWNTSMRARTRAWNLLPEVPAVDSLTRSQDQQHWGLPPSARFPRTHSGRNMLRDHIASLHGGANAESDLLTQSNAMAFTAARSSGGHVASDMFASDVIKAARLRSNTLRAEQTGRKHIQQQLSKTLRDLHKSVPDAAEASSAPSSSPPRVLSALTLSQDDALLPAWLLLASLHTSASAGQVAETEMLVHHYLQSLPDNGGDDGVEQQLRTLPNHRHVFPVSRPDDPPPGAHLLNAILRAQRIAYAAQHPEERAEGTETLVRSESGEPGAVQDPAVPPPLHISGLHTVARLCGPQGVELQRSLHSLLDQPLPPYLATTASTPRLVPDEQTIVHLLSSLFSLSGVARVDVGIALVRHAMKLWAPPVGASADLVARTLHLGIRPLRMLLSWAERAQDRRALQDVVTLHAEWRARAGNLGRPRPGMDGHNRGKQWAAWVGVVRRVKRAGWIGAQDTKRLTERGGLKGSAAAEDSRGTEGSRPADI